MVIVLDPVVEQLERLYALPTLPSRRVLTGPQERLFREFFPGDLDARQLQALVKADEMLANPKHWTRGCNARNWLGVPVSPGGHFAHSLCAMGAVRRATCGEGAEPTLRMALSAMSMALFTMPYIVSVNDDLGYQPMREVFGKLRAYYGVGR